MKEFMSRIKKPLIFIILGAMVVGYYFYLSNRKVDNTDKITETDAVSVIADRDLTLNYPGTARAVVIFYSDMLKVIYSEKMSDSELSKVASQFRGIFDNELLAYNSADEYLASLAAEINEYKDAGRTVADYVIEDNSNIDYLTYEGHDYAKIDATYFVHEGKNIIKTYEKFTLRKDDDSKWKILYWEVGKASDMEGQ